MAPKINFSKVKTFSDVATEPESPQGEWSTFSEAAAPTDTAPASDAQWSTFSSAVGAEAPPEPTPPPTPVQPAWSSAELLKGPGRALESMGETLTGLAGQTVELAGRIAVPGAPSTNPSQAIADFAQPIRQALEPNPNAPAAARVISKAGEAVTGMVPAMVAGALAPEFALPAAAAVFGLQGGAEELNKGLASGDPAAWGKAAEAGTLDAALAMFPLGAGKAAKLLGPGASGLAQRLASAGATGAGMQFLGSAGAAGHAAIEGQPMGQAVAQSIAPESVAANLLAGGGMGFLHTPTVAEKAPPATPPVDQPDGLPTGNPTEPLPHPRAAASLDTLKGLAGDKTKVFEFYPGEGKSKATVSAKDVSLNPDNTLTVKGQDEPVPLFRVKEVRPSAASNKLGDLPPDYTDQGHFVPTDEAVGMKVTDILATQFPGLAEGMKAKGVAKSDAAVANLGVEHPDVAPGAEPPAYTNDARTTFRVMREEPTDDGDTTTKLVTYSGKDVKLDTEGNIRIERANEPLVVVPHAQLYDIQRRPTKGMPETGYSLWENPDIESIKGRMEAEAAKAKGGSRVQTQIQGEGPSQGPGSGGEVPLSDTPLDNGLHQEGEQGGGQGQSVVPERFVNSATGELYKSPVRRTGLSKWLQGQGVEKAEADGLAKGSIAEVQQRLSVRPVESPAPSAATTLQAHTALSDVEAQVRTHYPDGADKTNLLDAIDLHRGELHAEDPTVRALPPGPDLSVAAEPLPTPKAAQAAPFLPDEPGAQGTLFQPRRRSGGESRSADTDFFAKQSKLPVGDNGVARRLLDGTMSVGEAVTQLMEEKGLGTSRIDRDGMLEFTPTSDDPVDIAAIRQVAQHLTERLTDAYVKVKGEKPGSTPLSPADLAELPQAEFASRFAAAQEKGFLRDFIKGLTEANKGLKEKMTASDIMERSRLLFARAEAWAANNPGKTGEDYYTSRFRSGEEGTTGGVRFQQRLHERKPAAVDFAPEGNNLNARIVLTPDSNPLSVLHELGHIFQFDLEGSDMRTAAGWLQKVAGKDSITKVPNGYKWTVAGSERFVEGFQEWMKGAADKQRGENFPTNISSVFAKFKNFLRSWWQNDASYRRASLSTEMRGVFNRLFYVPVKPTAEGEMVGNMIRVKSKRAGINPRAYADLSTDSGLTVAELSHGMEATTPKYNAEEAISLAVAADPVEMQASIYRALASGQPLNEVQIKFTLLQDQPKVLAFTKALADAGTDKERAQIYRGFQIDFQQGRDARQASSKSLMAWNHNLPILRAAEKLIELNRLLPGPDLKRLYQAMDKIQRNDPNGVAELQQLTDGMKGAPPLTDVLISAVYASKLANMTLQGLNLAQAHLNFLAFRPATRLTNALLQLGFRDAKNRDAYVSEILPMYGKFAKEIRFWNNAKTMKTVGDIWSLGQHPILEDFSLRGEFEVGHTITTSLSDWARLEKRFPEKARPMVQKIVGAMQYPMRMLDAADFIMFTAFSKSFVEANIVREVEQRIANGEVARGDRATELAKLRASTPKDLVVAAGKEARATLMRDPSGKWTSTLERAGKNAPVLRAFFMPFIKFQMNGMVQSFEYVPGLEQVLRATGSTRPEDIARRYTPNQWELIAKQAQVVALATGVAATFGHDDKGLPRYTGSMMSYPVNERKRLASLGVRPYSINLGGRYVGMTEMQPLDLIFGGLFEAIESYHNTAFQQETNPKADADWDNTVSNTLGSMFRMVVSALPTRNVAKIMAADSPGQTVAQSLTSTLIPYSGLMRNVLAAITDAKGDPKLQQRADTDNPIIASAANAFIRLCPFGARVLELATGIKSHTVLNVFGEPQAIHKSDLFPEWLPLSSRYNVEVGPVDAELLRIGKGPDVPYPNRRMDLRGATYSIPRDLYDGYAAGYGKDLKAALGRLIETQEYKAKAMTPRGIFSRQQAVERTTDLVKRGWDARLKNSMLKAAGTGQAKPLNPVALAALKTP